MSSLIALIPARGGSKGIPHKNVIDFCGKPLVAWTIEQVLGSGVANAGVYVSTDDPIISDVSRNYGASVIDRPPKISTDTASTESAILHAVELLNYGGWVLLLQATSPLRNQEDLCAAVDRIGQFDSLFSASELKDYCIWQTDVVSKTMTSLTYDFKNRGSRQTHIGRTCILENGSFYLFHTDGFKRYRNRLHGEISYHLMDPWKSYEIDDPGDVELCAYYMNSKIIRSKSEGV